MGCIYGGMLSACHEVCLIDTNAQIVEQIQKCGVTITYNGDEFLYHPQAAVNAEGLGEMDLVILFVKAMYSQAALEATRGLIGEHTCLMTLQNGAGHEEVLGRFVPEERMVIGTTEDNGAVLSPAHVRRGGRGRTNIGMTVPDENGVCGKIKEAFDACGFDTQIHGQIQELIWNKLLTNTSLSAVTAVLKCNIGFLGEDEYAWQMVMQLLDEGCAAAAALGLHPDKEALKAKMAYTAQHSKAGVTSICADLRAGRKTEVDTISGALVRAARRAGAAVPTHEFVWNMVRAMEHAGKEQMEEK